MDDSQPIQILDKLSEHPDFQLAVFFSYGAELAFFEDAVLWPLWQKNCHNVLVFMDSRRYADTIRDMRGGSQWAGRRYIMVPVDLGYMHSFHPKTHLLLGANRGRLLVGSGNLTFSGLGHNREVFTCLDWTREEPAAQAVFGQAWAFVKAVSERWSHSKEAGRLLMEAEYESPWLAESSEPSDDITLLHTLQAPLLEQCSQLLESDVIDRITVVSPFLDESASALGELHARFRPQQLRLVLQSGQVTGSVQALEGLVRDGVPLELYDFGSDARYVHAKVYVLEGREASYLLTGSANCTRAALLSDASRGNVETMLLRRLPPAAKVPLLEDMIAFDMPVQPGGFAFRPTDAPISEPQAPQFHLLDVTLERGVLTVNLRVRAAILEGTRLLLRLTGAAPESLHLPHLDPGDHTVAVPVPSDLLRLLMEGPYTAGIWAERADGMPAPMNCPELWLTNLDVLDRERNRSVVILPPPLKDTDSRWDALYRVLEQLVVLDMADLRRRGSSYLARVDGSTRRVPEPRDIQVVILPADPEPEANHDQRLQLSEDGAPMTLLDFIGALLPGALPTSRAVGAKQVSPFPVPRDGEHARRAWTPDERIGRRFVNLVDKYTRSLDNAEYMQLLPVANIVTYYAVFQRIVLLLHQHQAIDRATWLRLSLGINRGFFGGPSGPPPVAGTTQSRYTPSRWREHWRQAEVASHALASAVASEEQATDLYGKAQLQELQAQNIRLMATVVSVMGYPWAQEDIDSLGRTAAAFTPDGPGFVEYAERYVKEALSAISFALQAWIDQAVQETGKTRDPQRRQVLFRAILDYGIARCHVSRVLGDPEAEAGLHRDLIVWVSGAGRSGTSGELFGELIAFLQESGNGLELARAVYKQARGLAQEKKWAEASSQARVALALAQKAGNADLEKLIDSVLQRAEVFGSLADDLG